MNKTLIIIFVLLFGFSFSGIAQRKASKKKHADKELTDRDRYAQADLFMQAMREKALNHLEKANELLDQSLKKNDKDAASHYEKAKILQAMDRSDQAMEEAHRAISLDPANKWYKVLYANVSKANDQYDTYVAVYE